MLQVVRMVAVLLLLLEVGVIMCYCCGGDRGRLSTLRVVVLVVVVVMVIDCCGFGGSGGAYGDVCSGLW